MQLIQTAEGLRAAHGGVLVPTMGALHEGHISLIRKATDLRGAGEPVVVSIFVNPTQFGPREDYQTYPRNLEQDLKLAEQAAADVVFTPDEATMYGKKTPVPFFEGPDFYGGMPPAATEPGLEDRHRPGHFHGVCQVVARLFDLAQPVTAIFGEKDYQQLIVIQQMVERMGTSDATRWGELRVEYAPTVRDSDGLALSSRNSHLDDARRERALALSRAIFAARDSTDDAQTPGELEEVMDGVLSRFDVAVDYAVVRDARTLLPVTDLDGELRALVAATVDDVRLIDNCAVR